MAVHEAGHFLAYGTLTGSPDTILEVRSAHLLGCQVLGYKLDGDGSSSLQSGPHVRFAEPKIQAALRSAGPARQSLDSRVLGQYGTILMAGVAAEALLLKEASTGVAGWALKLAMQDLKEPEQFAGDLWADI
eukprot:SM000402S15220  [mRNA]  locus=s402:43469:44613:+ [translate_table: standard]